MWVRWISTMKALRQVKQNILWHKAQWLKCGTHCWRMLIPSTRWIQRMTGQICERIISSTRKYLFDFFWVTDAWGIGRIIAFLQHFFYTIIFLGLTHFKSLKSPNTLSSIIDFPFFTLSGEGFLCGARGLPVSEETTCFLLPVPCVTQGIPGAMNCGVISASNSSNGTRRETVLVVHHALDVEALYGSILASNLIES